MRTTADGVTRRASELLRGALELLLPPTCGACSARVNPAASLCPNCDRRLERIAIGSCPLCQEAPSATGGNLCASCEAANSPLSACFAAIRFEGDAVDWIHRFKYPKKGLRGLDSTPASVVGAMLREAADLARGQLPDWIVPVPLHPRRLRARGFNPAAVLARRLARDLGVRCEPVALRRTRDTPSQTGLDRGERRRNVRGAFGTRRGLIAPERIWLVDDVVTTTSTLVEAAVALRAAGARAVIGLCAARALSTETPVRR